MNVSTAYGRLFSATKADGKVRGVALDVYGIICDTPGLTGGEIFRKYKQLRPDTDRSRNEIAKRITDLSNWGGIETAGHTICPESGRTVLRWAPTGNKPKPKSRRRGASTEVAPQQTTAVRAVSTKRGAPTKELSGLEQEIADLRRKLDEEKGLAASRATAISLQNEAIARQEKTLKQLAHKAATAAEREQEALKRIVAITESGLQTRQELADLKASAVVLGPYYEDYVRNAASRKGVSPEAIINQAIMTYQAAESGVLVERNKLYKACNPEAKAQLGALATRSRLILRFRRFLPKRMVAQAEAVLHALEFAIANL